jgi:hypothetical protein
MLQVFYLDVANAFTMAFQVFPTVFASVQTHVSSVSSVFKHMLQIFHLYVSKIDQMLQVF